VDLLSLLIFHMYNWSLEHDVVTSSPKAAYITPTLKKTYINPTEAKSYGPLIGPVHTRFLKGWTVSCS